MLKELKKILSQYGYTFEHQRGSHMIFKKKNMIETIPHHKEISVGTARNILKSIADKNSTTIQEIIKTFGLKL